MTTESYNRYTGTWEDFRVNATRALQGGGAGASKPDFSYTYLALLFPQNDPSEIIYISDQMPHSWMSGTEIRPHVHWIQESSSIPVWKLDYRFYSRPVDYTWTTITTEKEVFTYPGSGSIPQISKFPAIDMGKYDLSTLFDFRVYRDDNVVTGDVKFKSFDFHYMSAFYGSSEEFPSYLYETDARSSRR